MRTYLLFALFLCSATSLSAQSITYIYDKLGRLTQASYPDSSVINYTYDASGNRTTIKTNDLHYHHPQTITFNPLKTIIYGSSDFSPGATASSGLPITYASSNASVATIINGDLHIVGAGTTAITASQAGNNIFAPATSVTDTLIVMQAALNISADNQISTYGGAVPALTATYTGFVNGDTFTNLSTQPTFSTTGTSASQVATYPITVSGAVDANYAITYTAGTLTIGQATLIITADDTNKIVGNPNPVLYIKYSGFVNGDDTTKVTVKPIVTTTATINSPVGTYPITISGASAANYTFNYIAGILTVNPIPAPTIISFTPTSAMPGTTVTITGTYFTGATVLMFGNTPAAFTVVSPTSITAVVANGASGNITVTTPSGTGVLAGFNFAFDLPSNNFELTIASATCQGSNDGSVNITATQPLSYTATITGNGLNASHPFTSSQTINNLAAGTYSVCITVAGQSGYQQCYDVVITEPKDLSLYTTINSNNTLNLALSGGTQYNITLNGTLFTTSDNTITLPLRAGDNDLVVATDKLCQGTIEKHINISSEIIPYPDPFQNTLSLNLGINVMPNVSIEVYNLSFSKLYYANKFGNQSGVLQIDLSSLENGVYALKLISDNGEKIFKILKQ